jgi:hypothetical protein
MPKFDFEEKAAAFNQVADEKERIALLAQIVNSTDSFQDLTGFWLKTELTDDEMKILVLRMLELAKAPIHYLILDDIANWSGKYVAELTMAIMAKAQKKHPKDLSATCAMEKKWQAFVNR